MARLGSGNKKQKIIKEKTDDKNNIVFSLAKCTGTCAGFCDSYGHPSGYGPYDCSSGCSCPTPPDPCMPGSAINLSCV